ncbi:P2 family phage major capsid protein, partial [Xenorhabdus bovienii]|uniref:P2 family phage major capsid protein n=1 Tax=Xenorhabdus bovienii TaxID=40576 RepID=UPI003DA358DE
SAFSGKVQVEPAVAQTLEDEIQQSADFLQKVNVLPVSEQSGQAIGLGVGSTIAGTTDTDSQDRATTDPTRLTAIEYKYEQTNFDTSLSYAKLDLWAKFQDFQLRIRNAIIRR